jgi:hypothetical protein
MNELANQRNWINISVELINKYKIKYTDGIN